MKSVWLSGNDCIFLTTEVLGILENLAILPSNVVLLVQNGILEVVHATVKSHCSQVRTMSLTLLWTICGQCKDTTSEMMTGFISQSLDEKEMAATIQIEVQLEDSGKLMLIEPYKQ